MARRVVTGGTAEQVRQLGPPLWEDRIDPYVRSGYVSGAYDDSGPLMALLWADIHYAYHKCRVSERDGLIFDQWLGGDTVRGISDWLAKTFAGRRHWELSPTQVQRVVDTVRLRLESRRDLGLLTTVYEVFDGWAAVRELMR